MTLRRYSILHAELVELANQFRTYSPSARLNHDLIWGPDCDPWDDREWLSFKEANEGVDGVTWEDWSLWPSRRACSRFWLDCREARPLLRTFSQLAERGHRILAEIGQLDLSFAVGLQIKRPRLNRLRLPRGDSGQHGWLDIVHEWAYRYPTIRLQGDCLWWRFVGYADGEYVAQHMSRSIDGLSSYHTFPVCCTLRCDVFTASAEFIQACLAPDHSDRVGRWDGPAEVELPYYRETPIWNAESGELYFGNRLIKKFRKPAWNQRKLLDEFQRQNWPNKIGNPFCEGTRSEKAFDAAKEAAWRLNSNHVELNVLRFGVVVISAAAGPCGISANWRS